MSNVEKFFVNGHLGVRIVCLSLFQQKYINALCIEDIAEMSINSDFICIFESF